MLNNRVLLQTANYISFIFHPILVPLYITLVLLFGDSIFSYATMELKLNILAIITIVTIILPMCLAMIMKYFRLIKDFKLKSRKDRIIPLLIGSISYMAILIFLVSDLGVTVLNDLFMTASVLLCFLLAATYLYKVSIYSGAISAMSAIFYVLTYKGIGDFSLFFAISTITMGIVSSARVLLRQHNLTQIILGVVIGVTVVIVYLA